MNQNPLDNIEKSGCYRWVLIVGAIITLLSGVGTLIQGDTLLSIGSLFLVAFFMIIAIGIVSASSVHSVSSNAREEIDQIRKERESLKEISIDQSNAPKESYSHLSPTKIGFIAGMLYGAVLGFIIILLGEDNRQLSIFLGGMVAFVAGVVGIIPAHIGWQWPNIDQARWAGAIVAGLTSILALSAISSDSVFSFWVGLFLSPSGWVSAMAANSYQYQNKNLIE